MLTPLFQVGHLLQFFLQKLCIYQSIPFIFCGFHLLNKVSERE